MMYFTTKPGEAKGAQARSAARCYSGRNALTAPKRLRKYLRIGKPHCMCVCMCVWVLLLLSAFCFCVCAMLHIWMCDFEYSCYVHAVVGFA